MLEKDRKRQATQNIPFGELISGDNLFFVPGLHIAAFCLWLHEVD